MVRLTLGATPTLPRHCQDCLCAGQRELGRRTVLAHGCLWWQLVHLLLDRDFHRQLHDAQHVPQHSRGGKISDPPLFGARVIWQWVG